MPDPTLRQAVTIRPLAPGDSIPELTALLHRAYASLAERGMRYLASHQDDETTRRRCTEGECHVAVHADGRIVGTIVLIPADAPSDVPYYDRPGVACFGQFAVEPALQGAGIGSRLMDAVERRAAEMGATEIALDTAECADHLIALYAGRGYRVVDEADWEVTNYRSVIMSRDVGSPASSSQARPGQAPPCMITIRPARPDDADEMLSVHVASIRGVCASHYGAAEIEKWAGPKRADRYVKSMESGTLLVAVIDGAIVGFGDCGWEGAIRALYLHPDHVGGGIGGRLLEALEADARARGVTEMELRSSLNAIAFYERAGYVRRGAEQFELAGGGSLTCERMTKTLSPS